MKKLLPLIAVVLSGCFQEPAFEFKAISFYCVTDNCPSELDTFARMGSMADKWRAYTQAWVVWKGWRVDFLDSDQWFYPGARGVTLHRYKNIQILVDDNDPLDPGVFDWEIGLPLAEDVLPYSSEGEKLQFRLDHDLVTAE